MGGSSSTYEFSKADAVHCLEFDERNLNSLRSYLNAYNPPKGCKACLNILLFGMMSAGKSATINTFFSALGTHGSTSNLVPTGSNPLSFTPEFRCYKYQSLRFWDTAGWNSCQDFEKTKKILRMILDGRLPVKTNLQEFDPDTSDGYAVAEENVIHGVAFIFNMFTVDNIPSNIMEQFKELQLLVGQKYIYRILIGTNIDQFESLTDYRYVYEYRKLQEKFENLSKQTGMEKRTMFAVSNELRGDKIGNTECILALYVLENMVRNIDLYFKATS